MRLIALVHSWVRSASNPESTFSAARTSLSRSTARSVCGIARAVSAIMNASLASVFDLPGYRSAALRIARPGRYATVQPLSRATAIGSAPMVLGWSTITSTRPCCCRPVKSSRSRASSCGSGLSKTRSAAALNAAA